MTVKDASLMLCPFKFLVRYSEQAAGVLSTTNCTPLLCMAWRWDNWNVFVENYEAETRAMTREEFFKLPMDEQTGYCGFTR